MNRVWQARKIKVLRLSDVPQSEKQSLSSKGVRNQVVPMATFLCTKIRSHFTRADFCVLNSGCLRLEQDFSGDEFFTAEHLFSMFFFDTELVVREIFGGDIRKFILNSRERERWGTGGFLQTCNRLCSSDQMDSLLDDRQYRVVLLAKEWEDKLDHIGGLDRIVDGSGVYDRSKVPVTEFQCAKDVLLQIARKEEMDIEGLDDAMRLGLCMSQTLFFISFLLIVMPYSKFKRFNYLSISSFL